MPDRKCNVCKHTYPHTAEHFDQRKDGRGLRVICRRCSRFFEYDPEKHAARKKRDREIKRRQRGWPSNDHPCRLSWLVQGGMWADLRQSSGG